MTRLLRYWSPGNVRELQNAVQRGIILIREGRIARADLPAKIAGTETPSADAGTAALLGAAVARRLTTEQLEREYIRAVLESVGGNKTEAAAVAITQRRSRTPVRSQAGIS